MRRESEPLEFGFPSNGSRRFDTEERNAFNSNPKNGSNPSNGSGSISSKDQAAGGSLDQDPTAVVYRGPSRAQGGYSKSEGGMHSNYSSSNPASHQSQLRPIDARRQIDQQRKEQRAWGSLLQGAATLIFGVIALCVALAAFGGYVLWKQIDNQSVTIGLLENNMRQEVQQLRSETVIANEKLTQELDSANLKLNALTAQAEEQREKIKNLNTEIEAQKAKLKQQETQLNRLNGNRRQQNRS